MSSQNLKEKFTGFAKKAFEKLKHPLDSIKEAIKHEQDRIIYWSKVADNADDRNIYLKYYSGVGAICASLMATGVVGTGMLIPSIFASSIVPFYIGTSRFFNNLKADEIMLNRAKSQSSYTGTADNNAFNDDTKEQVIEYHLRSAAQFGYIMDSAFKFGEIGKTLKKAEKMGHEGFQYTGRNLTSIDRSNISVAIRNLQKHAALAINDMEGAVGLADVISDPVKRAAMYVNIADYAVMLSKKSTLIPDHDNRSQSLGDVFLAKAEEYRQKADHITRNVASVLDHLAVASQDIQAFAQNTAITSSIQQARVIGTPVQQAFMRSLASRPDLNAQYANLQASTVQALTQAQDAVDTGLIQTGSPDSQNMVASLDAIQKGTKLWSLSPVKDMVNKLLNTLRPTPNYAAGPTHPTHRNSHPNGNNGQARVMPIHP